MLECVTSFTLAEHLYGHVYDPPTGPWAYTRVANPERKPFATRDGFIGLLPYTDQQWDQFFAVAGWGETFGKDPRFADYKTRARVEWLARLKPLRSPVVRTNRRDALQADPPPEAVGAFARYARPRAGSY